MNIFKKCSSIIIIYIILLIISPIKSHSQNVIWANKLLEYTEKFQFENNFSELVLGPPTIYSSGSLEEIHDPYSEGYIINYMNIQKRNIIKIGFPSVVNANQVIIGGIFNIGTIEEIYSITKNGEEKQVYKLDKPSSKTKFKSFATFIPYGTIYGLKIVINHNKINEWNIIKGIGLTNSTKLFEIKPDLIEDTTHHHTKEIIGNNINSDDCFEFAPKIAPDGKTLYFVKECQNQANQDIWFSELDSAGKWKEAKNIGVPLNNKGHNFVASISPDGHTLVIGNKYKEDGTDGGEGVSISTKDDDNKWSAPKSLDIPNYKNLNEHANFYMGPDGNELLMALQDEKSEGDLDLYVSLYNKSTRQWSSPINLGKSINTAFSEDYPYLANDGKTLFFSSKGYTGYGGHDIYVSERLDDTWTNWSKPLNLGPFVNSKADDKGFVVANVGDHAYFNSAAFNSDMHHMDIFKVDLPKMLRQEPRILLSGILTEEKSNSPLRGNVTVKNNNGQTIAFCSSNPKTGHYVMAIPWGKTYDVYADAIDHFRHSEKLSLTDSVMPVEVIKDFAFVSFMDSGQVYTIENIQFEYNKAAFSENTYHAVDKIAEMMKQQRKATYEISGHTDSIGTKEYNRILSEQRSKTVVDYLISKGIDGSRLTVRALGESNPLTENDTDQGRAINRRVEFKVTNTDGEKRIITKKNRINHSVYVNLKNKIRP